MLGRPEEGLSALRTATRLDPLGSFPFLRFHESHAHLSLADYSAAIEAFKRAIRRNPSNAPPPLFLPCLVVAPKAPVTHQQELDTLDALGEFYSVATLRRVLPYRNLDAVKRILDALREAGMPE